jgi:hypothetical protein
VNLRCRRILTEPSAPRLRGVQHRTTCTPSGNLSSAGVLATPLQHMDIHHLSLPVGHYPDLSREITRCLIGRPERDDNMPLASIGRTSIGKAMSPYRIRLHGQRCAVFSVTVYPHK